MSGNDGSMYWITNKDWWEINEAGEFQLTNRATEEAKKSFEKWEKSNKV